MLAQETLAENGLRVGRAESIFQCGIFGVHRGPQYSLSPWETNSTAILLTMTQDCRILTLASQHELVRALLDPRLNRFV